ncbi:MAG: hypothetical protein HRU00_16150 [Myxococcales bacterium]|nr:hypothetical protein [Myxococcales bacterium]
MRPALACLCCLVFLLVGCQAIPKEAKDQLSKPVECETSEQDIKALNAHRTSGGQRVVQGVTAVIPISAVIGILSGGEGDKIRVASGAHNQSIDEKIAEIRETCGLPVPPK